VELYPIFDRVARRRAMVNSERYEQERAALGRLLRYLAKTIPAEAKEVLEGYPFVAVCCGNGVGDWRWSGRLQCGRGVDLGGRSKS
jgi:hypothetical protein